MILLLLFTVTTPLAASPRTEIEAVLGEQVAAWNRGDIETFMTGYDDTDTTSFISNTVIKGYNTLLERYRNTYGGDGEMGTLQFSDLDIRILSEQNALVIGRFELTRDPAGGGDAQGIFSLVWALTDGRWKIIHDHTSATTE